MQTNRLTPANIILKSIVTHTVTYFLMGVISFLLLDYTARVTRLTPSTNTCARRAIRLLWRVPLQPLRGLIFGIVIVLLRKTIFQRRNGWLILWIILVAIGIISPYGAAPGSIEGMIYTTLPFSFHLNGLPETLIQSCFLGAAGLLGQPPREEVADLADGHCLFYRPLAACPGRDRRLAGFLNSVCTCDEPVFWQKTGFLISQIIFELLVNTLIPQQHCLLTIG